MPFFTLIKLYVIALQVFDLRYTFDRDRFGSTIMRHTRSYNANTRPINGHEKRSAVSVTADEELAMLAHYTGDGLRS